MKKIIILICMLCILISLSSCDATSGINNNDYDASEKENNDTEENIEVESKPLYVDSVDELIETIKNVKEGKRNNTNNISELNTLIVPDFTIDGYYLFGIEVTKVSVFYYYTPLSVSRVDGLIRSDRDYVVTVRRSEYVDKSNPLQPLIDQLKITPTDDGYLYDSKNNVVIFAYENVWVSISAPKSVNYQEIKSLCTVKSVEID